MSPLLALRIGCNTVLIKDEFKSPFAQGEAGEIFCPACTCDHMLSIQIAIVPKKLTSHQLGKILNRLVGDEKFVER